MVKKDGSLSSFVTGLKPKTQPAAQQRKLAFSTKTANGSETKGHSTQKPQSTQSAAPKENEKSQKEQILVDDDSGDATPEPSASTPRKRSQPDEDDLHERIPSTQHSAAVRKKRQTEGDEHVSKKPKLRATSRGTTTGQTGEGKVAVQKPAKKLTAAMAKQTIDEDEVMETTESEQDEDRAKSETEDEKPEIVAAARKKVQTTLIAKNEKDPYPDWPNGDPVPYAALCTAFSLIEMTTKRLQIMAYCTAFLLQVLRLTPGDLLPVTQLMVNKIASDYAGIELGIGESLIMKAIGESSGRPLQKIKDDQHKIGDLGLVAAKSRSNQRSLWGAKPKQLTVRGVLESLLAIATTKGEGAQGAKVSRIRKLLSGADALQDGTKTVDITEPKGGASEAKFIVRTLEGKMRLGLAERTVLVSLAQAMVSHELRQNGQSVSEEKLKQGEAILKQVYSELPSYEVVVPAMLEHGIFQLKENCRLQPGVPLKPMLANPTKSITEVLDRFEDKTFTCEFKYDGERAQIHYVSPDSPEQYGAANLSSGATPKGLSAIFSRNSEDLSKKYPDVLAKLNTWIKPGVTSFVLDCETVAWDVVEKKVLPFQQLMTRKKKDVKIEDVKVRVCIYAFDLLFLNGEAMVKKPFRDRRAALYESFTTAEGEFAFARSMDSSSLDEIQVFLEESVKASCEGLMVKMLDGTDSGYEPSMRSRNWLKIKKDYLAGVGDSLDLVVLGAYHGRGKRTSVYGAFLLACYDAKSEAYETVCNIGTGFSEQVLEAFHKELGELVIERPKPFYRHSAVAKDQPDVWFEPRRVWEVKCADLTLSPRYEAAKELMGVDKGVSLRFPRFIRVREDKGPDLATSSRQVAEMYRRQESHVKTAGPSVDDEFDY